MLTDPNKFEIHLDGLTYAVVRSVADNKVYKLTGTHGTYVIARDFYHVWVELTRKAGSADIPLTEIGQKIEDHYSDKPASV
ncbi:MAG TPA: hypothetical protein VK668_17025 [Mucilaginibacter sp.]|nr:hypothetical protein [Mucilaginibacter sp.]